MSRAFQAPNVFSIYAIVCYSCCTTKRCIELKLNIICEPQFLKQKTCANTNSFSDIHTYILTFMSVHTTYIHKHNQWCADAREKAGNCLLQNRTKATAAAAIALTPSNTPSLTFVIAN